MIKKKIPNITSHIGRPSTSTSAPCTGKKQVAAFYDFSKQLPRFRKESTYSSCANYSIEDISKYAKKARPGSAMFYNRPRDDIMVNRNSYYQGISPSKETVLSKLKRGSKLITIVVELGKMSGRNEYVGSALEPNYDRLNKSFEQQGHIHK